MPEDMTKLDKKEVIQLSRDQKELLDIGEIRVNELNSEELKQRVITRAIDLLGQGDFEIFFKLENEFRNYISERKELIKNECDGIFFKFFLGFRDNNDNLNKIINLLGISKKDIKNQVTDYIVEDYKNGCLHLINVIKGENFKLFFGDDFFKNSKIVDAFKNIIWEKLKKAPKGNIGDILETTRLLEIDFQPKDIVKQMTEDDDKIIEEIKKFPKLHSEYLKTFDNLSIVLEFIKSDKEFIEKNIKKHGKNIDISAIEKELFLYSMQKKYDDHGYLHGWKDKEDGMIEKHDDTTKITNLLIGELNLSEEEITILSPTSSNASLENKIDEKLKDRGVNNVKIFCGDLSNIKPCHENRLPYLKLNALESPFRKAENKNFNGFNVVFDRKGLLWHLIFKSIDTSDTNHDLLQETLDGYFKILKDEGFVLIDAVEEKYSRGKLIFDKEKSFYKYVDNKYSDDNSFLSKEVSTKSLIDGYLKTCSHEFKELFNKNYKITYIGEPPYLLAKIEKNK